MEVARMVPAGSSTAKLEKKYMPLKRNGLNEERVFTTQLWPLTNTTSIVKRMKKECTELQGFKTRASPTFKPSLPKSPLMRLNKEAAITAFSAKQVFLVLLVIFTGP